jgi:hypothetical protein
MYDMYSSPIFYAGIYHSYKRRKLSTSTVQDIIDHRPFDLADFDIEDFDRDLPSHIFDIDGMYFNHCFGDCHSQEWA